MNAEFYLTDAELRILCSFFLSLPLPPLASVVGPPEEHEQSMDAYLEHAARGLVAKRPMRIKIRAGERTAFGR